MDQDRNMENSQDQIEQQRQQIANQQGMLEDQQRRLDEMFNELRRQSQQRQQPAPQAPPAQHQSSLSKPLNKPPEFDGKDKGVCSTFLSHLRLYIFANPSMFLTEQSKVTFAASYLRGQAFMWFEPHLKNPDDRLLHSFASFSTELEKNLGDPDRERTITRQLQALTQTTSASAYSTNFFKLSAFLDWNDEALRAQYYTGLKPEVKDALALIERDPSDVQDLSQLSIRLDNRIHERRIDAKSTSKSRGFAPPVYPRQPSKPVESSGGSTAAPMDLDASKNRKFKPLTPEEKKHRRENNLCLYCGGKGHKANECPQKARPRQANGTLSEERSLAFDITADHSGKE